MENQSDTIRRRSPGRPRRESLSRKVTNSPSRGSGGSRSKSPTRSKSPARKNQKIATQSDVSQNSTTFGESSSQGGKVKTTEEKNSNVIGNSKDSLRNINHPNQSSQSVASGSTSAGLPGDHIPPNVMEDQCVGVKVLKLVGDILPTLNIFFLFFVMLLFSAYMELEPCPKGVMDMIENIFTIIPSIYKISHLHVDFFIFFGLLVIQCVSYSVSGYAADALKNDIHPDASRLVRRLPELVGLGVHAVLCNSFMLLLYHFVPIFPQMVIENIHLLMIAYCLNVVIALVFKELARIELLPEDRDFLFMRLGAVGSIMISLTYLWGALFIKPNSRVVMMVVFQVLFMTVFIITNILCPECKSILVPKDKSLLSTAFESLIWMPFGLNFAIRHSYQCLTEFPKQFLGPCLLLQVMLNIVIICSCFMVASSERSLVRRKGNRVLLSAMRQIFEHIAIFVPLLVQPAEKVSDIPPTLIIIYSTSKLWSSFIAFAKALRQ